MLLVALVAAWPLGRLSDLPADVPAWAPALAVLVAGFGFGLLWPLAVLGLVLIAAPTLVVWAVLGVVWLLDTAKAVWNRMRGRPLRAAAAAPAARAVLTDG